jgi:three-Cys-motif partner protein
VKQKDRWPELCKLVEKDDGKPVRDSGSWAEDKLFFWNRYVDITTRAMVGHPKWPDGVVYLDLFAGPGVCVVRDTKRRLPGSPLIAANAPKPFTKILPCELDPKNAQACEDLLRLSPAHDRFKVFRGDCNEQITKIIKEIPRGALTLAFLDPTGLHANIDTFKTLASTGRVDLLILFPDAIDVLRNVEAYLPQLDSNLDRVLGVDSGWREKWLALGGAEGRKARQLFALLYKEQLKKHANYVVFGDEVISGPKGPLYRLVFASKSQMGLDFWQKVTKKDVGGQRRLDFD